MGGVRRIRRPGRPLRRLHGASDRPHLRGPCPPSATRLSHADREYLEGETNRGVPPDNPAFRLLPVGMRIHRGGRIGVDSRRRGAAPPALSGTEKAEEEGREWNRHAERGVGGEGKLNRRADPHGRRDKSLYRIARLLSWRGAPAGPRGRARVCRFAAWVGAGEPRPNAYARRGGGGAPPTRPAPQPEGAVAPPGLESPPRPAGVERGHLMRRDF